MFRSKADGVNGQPARFTLAVKSARSARRVLIPCGFQDSTFFLFFEDGPKDLAAYVETVAASVNSQPVKNSGVEARARLG